jgi:L-lactate dehydrogenase complex protein LldE
MLTPAPQASELGDKTPTFDWHIELRLPNGDCRLPVAGIFSRDSVGMDREAMRVGLFVTCLVDQMWSSIGTSTLAVLKRAGCEVEFDERQTCCGQPAFNTGYRREARRLAERFIELCEASGVAAVVSPSGSCTAMVHHYPALFPDHEEWRRRAAVIAARTFELSSFLVRVLKVEDVGARFAGRVTWHDACHGLRDLNIHSEPRRLISRVREAEFVELENADACCGFGGTFSVKYPEISAAILDQKIEAIERSGVDAVVSGDASCLMQIGGRLSRLGSRVRVMHLAELLAAT